MGWYEIEVRFTFHLLKLRVAMFLVDKLEEQR